MRLSLETYSSGTVQDSHLIPFSSSLRTGVTEQNRGKGIDNILIRKKYNKKISVCPFIPVFEIIYTFAAKMFAPTSED